MRALVIIIIFAITAFSLLLKYLDYSKRDSPIPENVRDVFDEEGYKKRRAYSMENLRFSLVGEAFDLIVILAILLLNVHHALYEYIYSFTSNIYLTSLFVLMVPILVMTVLDCFFAIYQTFVIEARYGFNKTTPKTFAIDCIKELLISIVVIAGIFSLFLFLYAQLGNWVFLAFFFVLILLQIVVTFISPLLIRIMNKLTPIEDGELKDKIEALASETGYKLKGIYMVDASKRSTKLNAFAAGFGKTKTIGLFDTLVEKMTADEIVAILAHEIGHAKKQHIIKSVPFSLLTFSILLGVAFFALTTPYLSHAFGFADINIAFSVFALIFLVSPLFVLLAIPSNAISRKNEYEADRYAKEWSGKEVFISALKKIYREDLGNLTPHPFVVMIGYSHPPLSQRVAALEKDEG